MRHLFVLYLLLGTLSVAFAQVPDSSFLASLNARNIGPAGMSGRVTAIDVDLQNPERIFIGTASGGVWKSEDAGTHWVPVFDDVPVLAIGALKIDQSNPSVIWVGTGEGNPRNSHNSGKGVYKSLDGGRSWMNMGLEQTRLIHRILVHPSDPNVVYVGAMGSAWGPQPERGVYRTVDGGKSWENILFVNDSTGVADMVMDPSNPNKILVSMWEFGRKPWIFNSGGKGSGIYMTHDGGGNWKRLTDKDGLPKGPMGRIGLAIARSNPKVVYALVEAKKNGLYKSTDGGFSWKLVSDENIGNRPFYYSEIYVDVERENTIWNLWSYVSRSEDGGKTFETLLDYGKGVHPDHHAFWQHPTEPNYMIEGNDGGLNISFDRGNNWRFITNIPVGQFYHIDIDDAFPYHVYGGMQDNGSWVGPAFVLKNGGIRNADWREVMFGDGFDVLPDRKNLRYGWAMSQGGNLRYFDKETGSNVYVKPIHPEGEELRFNWNAALAGDPFNDCALYYGSQYVHYSRDCGQSWDILSPDLTTNDTTKQQQHKSGGLTIDDTEAENHTTILAIATDPLDSNTIWAGTDDGFLHISRNRGETWTELSGRLPGLPAGSWIPQIHPSGLRAGEVFVVANNYRRNDWSAYLYHTRDHGKSWKRIADDTKIGGFILSVVQDPVEGRLLFLGADDGLYVSLNAGTDWTKWPASRIPPVQVRDLKIQETHGDLVVGTFGRAIWIVDDILPLRELAAESSPLEKALHVFRSPPAYQSEFRSVDGVRFTADAEFRGENKSRGAEIRIWRKEAEKDEEDSEQQKQEEDKPEEAHGKKSGKTGKRVEATIHILDSKRDTVRTFTRKLKPGMQVVGWNLRRDGVRFPTRRSLEEDTHPPSGQGVLPGTYLLVCEFGEWTDSTTIEVREDPRIPVPAGERKARMEIVTQFEVTVNAAFQAFEGLKRARENVKVVERNLAYVPDSVESAIKDLNKEVLAKIDSLEEKFMLPANLTGYRDNSKTLNSKLSTASSYLNSAEGMPGENALLAVQQARENTLEVVDAVNTFLENDWLAYRTEVAGHTLPMFEEIENVIID